MGNGVARHVPLAEQPASLAKKQRSPRDGAVGVGRAWQGRGIGARIGVVDGTRLRASGERARQEESNCARHLPPITAMSTRVEQGEARSRHLRV
jgi:hypothetical protein